MFVQTILGKDFATVLLTSQEIRNYTPPDISVVTMWYGGTEIHDDLTQDAIWDWSITCQTFSERATHSNVRVVGTSTDAVNDSAYGEYHNVKSEIALREFIGFLLEIVEDSGGNTDAFSAEVITWAVEWAPVLDLAHSKFLTLA